MRSIDKVVAATLAALAATYAVQAKGASPVPSPLTPKQNPGSSAAGSSTASAKNSGSSGKAPRSLINLTAGLRLSGRVPDFRGPLLNPVFRIPGMEGSAPASSGSLQVTEGRFGLDVAILRGEDATATFGVALPIRGVSSSDPTLPQGSEFGGFEFSLGGAFVNGLSLRAAVVSRTSTKLKLFDSHLDAEGGIYFDRVQPLDGGIGLVVKAGPEIVYPLRNSEDLPVKYGMQWGGRAKLGVDINGGEDLQFRIFAEAAFRRSNSYQVAGIEQGGGALFTVTPSLQYRVLDAIWFGVHYNHPISRPVGRENIFGDASLPGLMGGSLGLNLSVET